MNSTDTSLYHQDDGDYTGYKYEESGHGSRNRFGWIPHLCDGDDDQ
jgi:hypothetical protein